MQRFPILRDEAALGFQPRANFTRELDLEPVELAVAVQIIIRRPRALAGEADAWPILRDRDAHVAKHKGDQGDDRDRGRPALHK